MIHRELKGVLLRSFEKLFFDLKSNLSDLAKKKEIDLRIKDLLDAIRKVLNSFQKFCFNVFVLENA